MNNLKNILYRLKFAYKAKASADERGVRPGQIQGIGGWQNDPTFKNLGLWVADKFLQHHGQGSFTPIPLDRLYNDATIAFPDLDNPDNIEEYVEWVKNISTCYKDPGEGNMTEVLFGQAGLKFWLCANNLFTGGECSGLVRNEAPIILPQGSDILNGELLNAVYFSSETEEGSPYTAQNFTGKSISEIRALICQMHFKIPNKNWNQATEQEKQNARYAFIQSWLNNTMSKIYSTYTGPRLKQLDFFLSEEDASFIIRNNGNRGPVMALCGAVIQPIIAGIYNWGPLIINSFEEFQYRRTRELLKLQAMMYFTLLLNSNICNELSGEERVKCRCGIKKRPAPPPQPEPEVEMELGPATIVPPQFGGPIGYRPVRRKE